MNVLEVHPHFAWWFDAANSEALQSLREAAPLDHSEAKNAAFSRLAPSRAFYLIGNAATFRLLPGTFDQIIVRYLPAPVQRRALERLGRKWLSPSGTLRFEPILPERLSSLARHFNDEEQSSPFVEDLCRSGHGM